MFVPKHNFRELLLLVDVAFAIAIGAGSTVPPCIPPIPSATLAVEQMTLESVLKDPSLFAEFRRVLAAHGGDENNCVQSAWNHLQQVLRALLRRNYNGRGIVLPGHRRGKAIPAS